VPSAFVLAARCGRVVLSGRGRTQAWALDAGHVLQRIDAIAADLNRPPLRAQAALVRCRLLGQRFRED
jgi:hypothetical protein